MSKEVVFGSVDWNEGDVGNGGGKSDFLRLEQGKTKIRVMGDPCQVYCHWVETTDGKKRKFNSPISDQKLVKELEAAGFKRKPSWIIKVLDRASGEFKLLEIGTQIYTGIKELLQDEEWGKPITGYDLTITRKSPGNQPLYQVNPVPKAALEASLKESFVAFNDRVDLTKLTQPGDPDQIRDFLGWSKPSTSKKVVEEAEADDDAGYFDFES